MSSRESHQFCGIEKRKIALALVNRIGISFSHSISELKKGRHSFDSVEKFLTRHHRHTIGSEGLSSHIHGNGVEHTGMNEGAKILELLLARFSRS
jgi:hypothetical protein